MKINLFTIGVLSIFLGSCSKNEPSLPQAYQHGAIVINAGNFTDNNGTLSFIKSNSQEVVYDIFQKENMRSIAGGISDYAEVNQKGLILVDNSTTGKDLIEIVDANTFKSISNIPNIENPRRIAKINETKAYITAWDATDASDFNNFYKNAGYVAVIDLGNNQLIKKITVQNGAETIQVVGNEAFVGSTGSGKTILNIIDTQTDAIKQSIEVGKDPHIIGTDNQNKLWIYATDELLRLNPSTKIVETRKKIISNNSSKTPSSFAMSADRKSIYFTYSFYDSADNYTQKGETYRFAIDDSNVNTSKPFINRLFGGGLSVDAQTGNLYAGLIPSYKQAGYVFRYQADGVLIDSLKAEIAPSRFFFK
jgi:hypothetical protein